MVCFLLLYWLLVKIVCSVNTLKKESLRSYISNEMYENKKISWINLLGIYHLNFVVKQLE